MRGFEAVEFGRAHSLTRLGLVCLMSGLVALGASGGWLWRVSQAYERAQQERQRLLAANEALREQAVLKAQQIQALADERRHDPRWRRAHSELNWPWLHTLGVLERLTRPPVYLLKYAPDPASGMVTVEAEVDRLDEALLYLQTLQAVPEFQQVRLLRHEEAKDPLTARMSVRFLLQVHRRERVQ